MHIPQIMYAATIFEGRKFCGALFTHDQPHANVTEYAKTGLICTNYTYSLYHIYLFFYVGYTISVSFNEFLRKFCVAI